jgi:ABC-type microcin C transport system duplicated ATPase subunit YejF
MMLPGRTVEGQIIFEGCDLRRSAAANLPVSAAINFIFQEPMTSLNLEGPSASRVAESLRCHERLPGQGGAWSGPSKMLKLVQISNARRGCTTIRTIRRHAPTRHDRDGAGLQAKAGDCRRAHQWRLT